jgi:hypothetical protein
MTGAAPLNQRPAGALFVVSREPARGVGEGQGNRFVGENAWAEQFQMGSVPHDTRKATTTQPAPGARRAASVPGLVTEQHSP